MIKTLGQIAYEAYSGYSGGKSLVSGADLPVWDALASEIRSAWQVTANAVFEAKTDFTTSG